MGCEYFFRAGREAGDIHMLAIAGYLCANAFVPASKRIRIPEFKSPHRCLRIPAGKLRAFRNLTSDINAMCAESSMAKLKSHDGRHIAKLIGKLTTVSQAAASFVSEVDREIARYGEDPHQCFRLGVFTRLVELLAARTGRSYVSVIKWALQNGVPGPQDGEPWLLPGEREFFNEKFNIGRLRAGGLIKTLIDKCMPEGRSLSAETVKLPEMKETVFHMLRQIMPMLPDTIEFEIERKPRIKEWSARVKIRKYLDGPDTGYVILPGNIPKDFEIKGKMRIYGLFKKLNWIPAQITKGDQSAYDELMKYEDKDGHSRKYESMGVKLFCDEVGIQKEKSSGGVDDYFAPLQRCMETRIKLLKITFVHSSRTPVSSKSPSLSARRTRSAQSS